MKRSIVVSIAAICLASAAPAAADFHSACPTGGGSANVNMTASGGTFTFSGVVNCGGATSISISSLTLRRPDNSTVSAPPASCGPCNSLSASGTDPAGAPGTYTVTMTFSVTGNAQSFTRQRVATFSWDGTTLTRTSGGGGAPDPFEFCDANQPVSMTADFANDNSNMASPFVMRWSGRLECHGADELRVNQISVRRQLTGNNTIDPAHPGRQDAACGAGCGVVTGSGSSTTDGPGVYRVTFRITITKNGEARSATIQRDWFSLGLGPVVPQ